MTIHPSITEARIVRAVKRDDGTGFCVLCGRTAPFYVEPDAEKLECPYNKTGGAKHKTVYGAERLLLMTVA